MNDRLTFATCDSATELAEWSAFVRQNASAGWGQLPAIALSYAEYGATIAVHVGRDAAGAIRCGALMLCFQPLPVPIRFASCLGGPVAAPADFGALVDYLGRWGATRRLSHIMLSPATSSIQPMSHAPRLRRGSSFAPVRYPLQSLVIDVRRSDEELLASFRADTRRNIRRAAKSSQTLERVSTIDRARAVTAWIHATHLRQGVPVRSSSAFAELANQLIGRGEGEILAVIGDGEIRAAGLFPIAGNAMWYLSGAVDRTAKESFPAHVLQFRAMTLARDLGLERYDFTSRSVSSVYEFKRGFRPVEYETAGEFDLPIFKPAYRLLELAGPWALRNRRKLGAWISRLRTLTRRHHA